jgi:hypothetical protein
LTGSWPTPNTIGIVVVAALAAIAVGVLGAAMMATGRRTIRGLRRRHILKSQETSAATPKSGPDAGKEAAAFTQSGSSSTPEVIITFPPRNVRRYPEYRSRFRFGATLRPGMSIAEIGAALKIVIADSTSGVG